MAEPDGIARSLPAPASDDFPYMTGASVAVDGGAAAGRKTVRPATE
ncbi:hypothetical protein [Streptomyces sp. NPDC048142]